MSIDNDQTMHQLADAMDTLQKYIEKNCGAIEPFPAVEVGTYSSYMLLCTMISLLNLPHMKETTFDDIIKETVELAKKSDKGPTCVH